MVPIDWIQAATPNKVAALVWPQSVDESGNANGVTDKMDQPSLNPTDKCLEDSIFIHDNDDNAIPGMLWNNNISLTVKIAIGIYVPTMELMIIANPTE